MLIGLGLVAAAGACAQELRQFRIGTGSTAGTYFPIGALIATAISRPPGSAPCGEGGACGVDNLLATAVTSLGSTDNIEGVIAGRLDSGLAQADVVAWALEGAQVFAGGQAFPDIRVIANLYPEHVHLVVRRNQGMLSAADLGGRRVAIDRVGSGTRINAEVILGAYGLGPKDYDSLDMGPEASIGALLDGTIDAAFFVVGYPSAAVRELADSGEFSLAAISGPPADRLTAENPYYTQSAIPPGVYDGIGIVPTLSVGALWIVGAAADEELIYNITRAFWDPANRKLLDTGHAKGRQIRLESALSGVSAPLHPGAARFYREAGLPGIQGNGSEPSAIPGTVDAAAAAPAGTAPATVPAPPEGPDTKE